MIDLQFNDIEDSLFPATLKDELSYEALVDSQDQYISVQYNQIDLGGGLDMVSINHLKETKPICILNECINFQSRQSMR